MSVARKAGFAVATLFLRKCWSSLLNLGVIAYLASTLEWESFGLVAMCATSLALIQIMAVSGISEFVIFYNEKKADYRDALNAAFWLNFFVSIVVILAALLALPVITMLVNGEHEKDIAPLVLLLLVSIFCSIVASIPRALFRKAINYGPMVAIETVQLTLVSIGQVTCAWKGLGVYSLVLPSAVVGPFIAIFYLRSAPKFLTRGFGLNRWREIFRYTKHIIGARLLTRFANEGDNLIIGAVLGMGKLGAYHLAYKMANIVFLSLMPVVADISLPVLAKSSDQRRRLFVRYSKMISLIAFTIIPILMLVIVNAGDLSNLIYGKDLALLVQILTISVIGRCISSPTGGLFNATGRPHIPLGFVCIFTPLFLGLLWLTARYGLVAAAGTVAICFTIGQLIQTWLASRYVFDRPLKSILINVQPYLAPTIIAGAFAIIVGTLLDGQTKFERLARVILVSGLFLAAYWFLLVTFSTKALCRMEKLFYSIHPKLGNLLGLVGRLPRAAS